MNVDKRNSENIQKYPLNIVAEDSGLLSKVKKASYGLLTLVKSTSPPRHTPEDIEELEKSRGLDKLKYEKGKPYCFHHPGTWLTL